MTRRNTVVIGAGAAGLAAARALRDRGRAVVVLEARDRIGGRVWTDYRFGPAPVERGAEFIHGTRVATWEWLRRAGLTSIAAPPWAGRRIALGGGRLAGTWLLALRPDLRRLPRIGRELAGHQGPDCSLAEWTAARQLSPLARHILDVRLAHASCATPEELSVAALADEERHGSADSANFRVAEGYDRLLAAIGTGLEIRLGTPALLVRWDQGGAEIVTARETFAARHVVVTLPLAVLKAGAVRFDPALPPEKWQAIEGLAMAPALKLLMRFDAPFWDRDMTFLTAHDPAPVWWTVRRGLPLLTAFLTGPRAARMAALGDAGAAEAGLGVLEELFGAAPRRLLAAYELVDWGADPWALGGYSSTPPGAHWLRAALAAPCGALHFAGEATVTGDNPATVHGALGSGARAAEEIAGQREARPV
jgi:monoamine oxidase